MKENNKLKKKSIVLISSLVAFLVIVIIVLLVLLINEKNNNSTKNNDSKNDTEVVEEQKIESDIDFVTNIDDQLVGFDKNLNSKVLVTNDFNNLSGFDIYNNTLYYVKDGFVHSIGLDGSNDKNLEIPAEKDSISMRVSQKYILFLKNNSNSVVVNKKTKTRKNIEFRTNNYRILEHNENDIIYINNGGISLLDLDNLKNYNITSENAMLVTINDNYLVYYTGHYPNLIYNLYDLNNKKVIYSVSEKKDLKSTFQIEQAFLSNDNELYYISNDSSTLMKYNFDTKEVSEVYQFKEYDMVVTKFFNTKDNNLIILRDLNTYSDDTSSCDVGCYDPAGVEILKYDISTNKMSTMKSELLEKYNGHYLISYSK